MEERKGLYRSLGRIAWGYALIYLNININALDLLPDWAGWLLIGSALPGDAWLAWPLVAVSLVIIVGTLVVMNTFQASLRDGGVEQE